MVSGRVCILFIISSFPAIIETTGERERGRRGRGEGGKERGEGIRYHIVENFRDFCNQTLPCENFFLQKFLADELRKSSTLSSSRGSSNSIEN